MSSPPTEPGQPAFLPPRSPTANGGRPPEPLDAEAPPGDELPPWPWWSPLVALAVGFLVTFTGLAVLAIVIEAAGGNATGDDPSAGLTIGGTLIQEASLVAAVIAFAWMYAGRPTPRQFGIRATKVLPAIGWTVVVMALFLAFSASWAALFDIDEPDDLPNEIGADESTAALIGVAFLVCVVAPFAEEFVFRGYLFTALRRWRGALPALIITGAMFGLVHAGSSKAVYLVPLAVFGGLLCWLYMLSGSLIPCILLHAINNSLALGASQSWSAGETLICVAAALILLSLVLVPLTRSGRLNTPGKPPRPPAPPQLQSS